MTFAKGLKVDVEKIRAAFPPPWSHPSYRSTFLTNAEIGVLKMVAYGKTNQEIAAALFVDVTTTRTHAKKIHAKCDIKGRARLAIAAYEFYNKENKLGPRQPKKETR